jgi:hypothetical protein
MKNKTIRCIVAAFIALLYDIIFKTISIHYGVDLDFIRGATMMLLYFILYDIFTLIYDKDT